MKGSEERGVEQLMEGMSPFQLLSYYADTAALEGVLQEGGHTSLPHYLMFMADGEGFLISIDDINSVIRDKPVIKSLPFASEWFKGLSSVRNEIVSVISFAQLYGAKNDSTKQREKHYILLSGTMEGFLLEVDKLVGIRPLAVQSLESGREFIDGEVTVDELRWQRINLDALLATKLNKKMEF